jgi:D-lactate dehydrogenase
VSRTDLLTRDHPHADLESLLPGGVKTRATDRLAYSHDASHYVLAPQAVLLPRTADDVARVLRMSAERGLHLTFRSGGTSLSGQALSDGLLVDTRRHFRSVEVLDDGRRVRLGPGVTVRAANARLAPYGRKLGPDPASESACTIGGVVANNSSGMACGTEQNTYRTLDSAALVLASGTVIDTGAADADERLRALEPHLHDGLIRLRERVRANPQSVATVRRLFSIKNTMGYGLNAFLDHERPVDLLLRLVIGSEGTLAFVAEATFRTVPLHSSVATGLLLFDSLERATESLPALVEQDLATIELLDATSLRVAQQDARAVPALRDLAVDQHAALLVEHQQPNAEELEQRVAATAALLPALGLTAPTALSTDTVARAALWHIRKGRYAAVAGARPSGTTALLEDIAVPVGQLAATCRELAGLFARHEYGDSVVFGHAKDGNIHFLLNERFDRDELVQRYLRFTDDMVDLVLAHGGTLKAEHGTGRVMAPYVRRQYGDELYDVMRELKALLDPTGLLNPGAVITDDDTIHVSHLKSTPTVEAEIDRCVECGYCEPVCPSKDLTTTPRQRIVLRREIARAREAGDDVLAAELEHDYDYDAVQTCAVDGMCATACPVLINTGDLTRRLRSESHSRTSERAWAGLARHWGAATTAASTALSAAKRLPPAVPAGMSRAARRALGDEAVPQWSGDLPAGGERRSPRAATAPAAVFFPSCTSTMFGGSGVAAAFLALCERADLEIRVPEGIASMCCGTPWKSKGHKRGYDEMRALVGPALTAASGSALPVVVDASSCAEGLHGLLSDLPEVTVIDAVAFVEERVLPHLMIRERVGSVVLHPTCSSTRLGLDPALRRLAEAAAETVVVPADWSCCAFAGDRGLLHPELTASATAVQAEQVRAADATAHVSTNRTCELGMSRATGKDYQHILELLLEVSA